METTAFAFLSLGGLLAWYCVWTSSGNHEMKPLAPACLQDLVALGFYNVTGQDLGDLCYSAAAFGDVSRAR